MPTKQEVDEVLELLAKYAEDIDHIVKIRDHESLLEAEPNTNRDKLWLRGHRCSSESDEEHYFIGAHEELEYVVVVYYLSFQQNIAHRLDEEDAELIVENTGLSDEEGDPRMQAASYMLDNGDKEMMHSFKSYFNTVVAGPDHYLQTHEDDNGVFQSYAIERRIFPYEEDFSLRDFNDAITTVVGVGQKSAAVSIPNLRIEIDEENPEDSRAMFQHP